MTEKPHVLYRMFDRQGQLLYVGITNNPRNRFSDHSKTQPWWSEVHNITVRNYLSREDLAYAESKAIREEKPLYNKACVPVDEPRRALFRCCGTCGSREPDRIPTDFFELLQEDGSALPFCTDPFHRPDDPQAAARWHAHADLLKQSGLLRLTAIAEIRQAREREALKALSGLLTAPPNRGEAS